jgi:DNA-binding MarR family transcriptional regulator
MASGQIEISYITDHVLHDQGASFDYLPLILIFSIIATLIFGLAFKFLRTSKIEKSIITVKVLDTEKLFNQHKHLRDEEIQVIQFLGENNTTAYEAQIYEKLNLPRTTTWRLLKRLRKMEIINIEKSRRQNIISIRKKYLKKNKSQK